MTVKSRHSLTEEAISLLNDSTPDGEQAIQEHQAKMEQFATTKGTIPALSNRTSTPTSCTKATDARIFDLSEEPIGGTYTKLLIHPTFGWWLCPKCPAPWNQSKMWYLFERLYCSGIGLKNVWKDDFDMDIKIPECYNGYLAEMNQGRQFEDALWFMNPSCATTCQNYYNLGIGGEPCDFDRMASGDKARDASVEKHWDSAINVFNFMCMICHVEVGRTFLKSYEIPFVAEDRAKYILDSYHSNDAQSYDLVTAARYPYGSKRNDCLVMFNPYDGTLESLRCGCRQFGKGNDPDGRDKPCEGRYGGPMLQHRLITSLTGEEVFQSEEFVPEEREFSVEQILKDEKSQFSSMTSTSGWSGVVA